ncbi:sensor histidine kinase [Paenibacillus sp. D2_2]|uniref:sensor histidine kinase n=1 Tax=Paenibacillus sp. D2_2 TaxID=3073092 RepID=UPI002815F96B|nr:sensor histidine kinase [Paenibacillus sp. D2_2]WMT40843.1 sensor histidine kinase [Paenibacillus sp. D2_2]
MNKLHGWNTLRNQIFIGFMLVMIIVLTAIGVFTYNQVSVLLRASAERHIKQTAVQTTGKLDALFQQIDSLMMQVSTNSLVQKKLAQEMDDQTLSFSERQSLQEEVRSYEAYATGIRSLELYTSDYRRLLPLDDVQLNDRVPKPWIQLADKQKGRLVWLGLDPLDPNTVIAIRSVRLIDRSYMHAGYLMLRIDRNYFELAGTTDESGEDSRETMLLFDGAGHEIIADSPLRLNKDILLDMNHDSVTIDGETFIEVRHQSELSGWTLVILTPARYTTEGISVLQTALFVSIAVGGFLFLICSFILSTMITRPILNLIRTMRGARFGTLKRNPDKSSTMELMELNHTYNQMVDSMNEMIQVVYQKEIIQSRTELKALQAQINPHFLFNTLEAFFWALDEKGEDELADNVLAMSGLFRYVISRSDDVEWVTIGNEVDHAELYFKIMEMRLIDRLEWRIDIEDAFRHIPIPKLMIQPLVENAIMHGVEKSNEPGTVVLSIQASDRKGYTRVTVSDSGPGMDESKLNELYNTLQTDEMHHSGKQGIGLINVERRLRLYYDSKASGLTIESQLGQGTSIMFEIPNEFQGGETHENHSYR